MAAADITPFGTTATGAGVDKITLRNDELSVAILTYGAIVQDVRLAGVDRSLTLGSERIADYEAGMRNHGALVGPVANRISNARVTLDGMTYELERNQDGRIHLHSGSQSTQGQLWSVRSATRDTVTLGITLGDGIAGLPGNREITATFRLDGPTLDLAITGRTDATTCMNFANHSYWNLDGSERWEGHQMRILADAYLPTDKDHCPTGDIAETTGTLMDLSDLTPILPGTHVLDHNFCLTGGPGLRDVLWLVGQSGVAMRLATNQPGLQVYDGRNARRPGRGIYEGLAIEAQGWPDAPNNPAFPQITVTPETPYHQHTRFTFLNNATK